VGTVCISGSRWQRWCQSKNLREFFLDLQNSLGLRQLLAQAGILLLELHQWAGLGVRFRATLFTRQTVQCAAFPLTPSGGQMGRVQTFPAQERPNLTGFVTLVHFFQNLLFIGRRKATPGGSGNNFWIRLGRGGSRRRR